MTRADRRPAVPDAGPRDSWTEAYEAGMAQLFERSVRSDEVLPLLYARRSNDRRLAQTLVDFARRHATPRADADAAEAILDVAQGALSGTIDKDLCAHMAGTLLEEAYERLLDDRRFDRYFSCQCAGAAARLAATVSEPASLRDAVGVIRAAAALVRVESRPPPPHTAGADQAVAELHRDALARLRSIFEGTP